VVHGLGRLADGGLDVTLFLTDPDGTTQRLTLTGDPLPGLANAAAIALKDGILMIAGGEGAGSTSDAIFHVDVAKRQVTAQMFRLSHARSHAGVALLDRGDVVLIGGTSTSGPLDSVEVYSPGGRSQLLDGNAFPQVRTNMHSPRVDPAVARLPDDSVAILGGGALGCEVFRNDLGVVGGLVDVTPPGTGMQVVTPAAGKLFTGDLFVVGGEVAGSSPVCAVFTPNMGPALDTTNPIYAGTWRSCTAGLNLRARAGAVVLPDQSVLVMGGGIGGEPFNPGMESANRVEVYEPIAH
jgi:hypothetical protein